MTLQEVKQLEKGDLIGFAGILSDTQRAGVFIRIINDHLAEIHYGDHTEQNHITNLFKAS